MKPAATNRPAIALLTAVVLVAGCSSASIAPTSKPSTTPSASTAPIASTAPVPPTAVPSVTVLISPAPGDALAGSTVVTIVDDVRVRSQPRISQDSYMEEPLLPRKTALFVLDGPVAASGYDWYRVAQLTSRTLPSGWIAGASRDGEPWIAPGALACPSVPTDFGSLAALPEGVGLACFKGVPITVDARLLSCACDIDGSWYTPSWFQLNATDLLVEPGVTRVPPDMDDWFGLNLDPAGRHPAELPIGKIVEVTGIFDHPAAATCTRTEMDGEPIPDQGCRLEFAVTRLEAIQP